LNQSASNAAVEQYWGDFLGVQPELLHEPTVTVVRHKRLGDWRGVWFFSRHGGCIVSAPEDWVERLHASRSQISPQSLTEDVLAALFGRHLGTIVGPAYDGYLRPDRFRPCRLHDTTPVGFHDEAVTRLREAADPEEWSHAALGPDSGRLTGCFQSNRIVALAGFRYHSPEAGDPGVITHPHERGRGYATAVVSRVLEQELARGTLVLYQTLLANRVSVSVAARLGFEQYASHVAVRLHD
jgi:GNAT superfamily N-acetyltransferase